MKKKTKNEVTMVCDSSRGGTNALSTKQHSSGMVMINILVSIFTVSSLLYFLRFLLINVFYATHLFFSIILPVTFKFRDLQTAVGFRV